MKNRIRIPWFAAAGVLLIIAGLAGLFSGPEISQYAFLRRHSDWANSVLQKINVQL